MSATHNASEQPIANVGDVWFRYEQRTYGSVDEFDILISTRHELELMEFKVAKVTPEGGVARALPGQPLRASLWPAPLCASHEGSRPGVVPAAQA